MEIAVLQYSQYACASHLSATLFTCVLGALAKMTLAPTCRESDLSVLKVQTLPGHDLADCVLRQS